MMGRISDGRAAEATKEMQEFELSRHKLVKFWSCSAGFEDAHQATAASERQAEQMGPEYFNHSEVVKQTKLAALVRSISMRQWCQRNLHTLLTL